MNRIRLITLAGAATLGLTLTACGADSGQTAGSAPTTRLAAAQTESLGTVVTDAEGRTLYRFNQDGTDPSVSNCAGDCAAKWPPALVFDRADVELDGVDQKLVGTITRADGSTQLTLAGSPLYRFIKDAKAGDTLGQGVGGTWFAATPAGAAPATAQPTQTSEPPSTDDGYGY